MPGSLVWPGLVWMSQVEDAAFCFSDKLRPGGVSAAAGRDDNVRQKGREVNGKRASEHPALGTRERTREGGSMREREGKESVCDESETSSEQASKQASNWRPTNTDDTNHTHGQRREREDEVATLA